MTAYVSGAACEDCDWSTAGAPVDCDKSAERHTKQFKHSTNAWTVRADLDPNGHQA